MILEILGGKCINAGGDVQVDYINEKTVIYNSEGIEHLVLNPDHIISITVNEKRESKLI